MMGAGKAQEIWKMLQKALRTAPWLVPPLLGLLIGFVVSALWREAEEWEIPHHPLAGLPGAYLMLTPTPTPWATPTPATALSQVTPTPPEGLDPEVLRRLPYHLQTHPLARVVWRPAGSLAKRLREQGAWLPDYRECQDGDDMCVFETQGEAFSYVQRMWESGTLRRGAVAYCRPWVGLVDGKPLPTPTPYPPDDPYAPDLYATHECAPGLTCYSLLDLYLLWGYPSLEEASRVRIEWDAFLLLQIHDEETRRLVELRWPFEMCRRALGEEFGRMP